MQPITITHTDPHVPSRPFTPHHVAVTVTFTASAGSFSFEYQYNPKYSAPTEVDFAYAFLLDAEAYDANPFTFAQELGMPMDTAAEQQEALHVWQECGRTAKFVLTQPERDYLAALAAKADDDDDDD